MYFRLEIKNNLIAITKVIYYEMNDPIGSINLFISDYSLAIFILFLFSCIFTVCRVKINHENKG